MLDEEPDESISGIFSKIEVLMFVKWNVFSFIVLWNCHQKFYMNVIFSWVYIVQRIKNEIKTPTITDSVSCYRHRISDQVASSSFSLPSLHFHYSWYILCVFLILKFSFFSLVEMSQDEMCILIKGSIWIVLHQQHHTTMENF